MSPTSPVLRALLTSLTNARQGTTLVLSDDTLRGTSGAPLLDLLAEQLQTGSFTLEDVELPSAVTGTEFVISGHDATVALQVTFADTFGEVAIEALFHAPAIAALAARFPVLPSDFFRAIQVTDEKATVAVPGLGEPLVFSAPRYGVAGLAIPSAGLLTTSVAPRVDGPVSLATGPKRLLVEIETGTTGYRVAPLGDAWTFGEAGELLPGLGLLDAFPAIIGTDDLGLRTFSLTLYTSMNRGAISLDVVDSIDPAKPLRSAAGGKVQLTDVLVTLDLTYSDDLVLSLSGTGSVQGSFLLGTLALAADIPFPPTGVWSLTAFPDAGLSVLDDLASLLPGGSSQFNAIMPSGLAGVGGFALSYLFIAVDAGAFSLAEFTFALQSTGSWRLIPGVIELTSLQLTLTIDGTPSVAGMVTGLLRLGDDADILVAFGRPTPHMPWGLDAMSAAIPLPSIGQLAQLAPNVDLAAMITAGGLDQLRFVMTNLNFGMTIAPAALTNLGLTLQLANASDPLLPVVDWEIIPGVLRLTQFSFGFQIDCGATGTKDVFGTFVLNDLEFDVRFASQATANGNADGLIGEYSAPGDAGTVNIRDLITGIAPDVAAHVPKDLDINVADAVLAYLNTDGKKKFLFAMDIAVELPVSDLPLVGKALPADALVGVKHLKVVVASAALSASDVAFINSMSAKPVLTMPAGASGVAVPAGFSMAAELEFGAVSVLLTSPPVPRPPSSASPSSASSSSASPGNALARRPAPGALAAAADPVMWVPVQKTFGPVQIQQIGFSYRDGGDIFVVANMSLAVGGLEIDLLGIGIGSPIRDPEPEFTIDGLAVSFTGGPVSILGGMIGRLDPLDFTGVLSVRTPELSLTAFAGYAEVDGYPSFFLYGVLDAPIGGPPAFFVTGIAAGVGFNRKLEIPDVAGVATFPLVAWAQGNGTPPMNPALPVAPQVGHALDLLARSGVVAPSVGDYWFAAGVRFTSFQIIQAFALLTVSFGTEVEIALLGLATLTLPPAAPEPVAQVQLALEVAFSPSKGLLAVAAQLTDNSYVLSRQARLTGGFAFYLWFDGDHAGETVVSLGGYNPGFTVPGYYPVVPRVGLNWQVVPELSITGELYFALTSNVVMAGGKLSAVWNSGPVTAWFTYWADFLMTFAPFHYYVNGGIDLGARFTIDMALFSISTTVQVGVTAELWGPPFAGRATVDLSVISFTILFNDHAPDAATVIPWDQFVRELLPGQAPAGQPPARPPSAGRPYPPAPAPAPPAAAVVQVNVTSGLVRELEPTADGPVYLVTAETFQCAVLTVIPSKEVVFEPDPDPAEPGLRNIAYAPDSEQPADSGGAAIEPNTDFGAGPAGIPPAEFQPVLTLSLSSPTTSAVRAYRRLSSAPKALWENKRFDPRTGVPQVDPATGLTEATIPDVLTGLTLVPYLDRPDRTLPVPLESLLFSLDVRQPFAWSPGVPPDSDPFTDQTVAGTIANPGVAAVRAALLDALAGQHVPVNTTVDVSRLASEATTDLQAPPRLRLLGGPAAG